MQYFHRTQISPDTVIGAATAFFAAHLAPTDESPRLRAFKGALGGVSVAVRAEGGHYTLVTVATDQPGESELDRLAKRFLGEVHRLAEPDHVLRGAY
ncbi:MAG: hypothetical protein ABJC19_10270 [Gemmatimonadota bacterium]